MGCSSSSNANKNLNNLNSLSLTMNDEIVDKILSSAPERCCIIIHKCIM